MARGQRPVAPHLRGRVVARQAVALAQLVVGFVATSRNRLVVEVGDLASRPSPKPQTQALDLLRDHVGPPDQDRAGEALVDHDLRRAQHAVVLALRVDDALDPASAAAANTGCMTVPDL